MANSLSSREIRDLTGEEDFLRLGLTDWCKQHWYLRAINVSTTTSTALDWTNNNNHQNDEKEEEEDDDVDDD